MPEFLIRGQDPSGAPLEPFTIQADSPEAARAAAARDGFIVSEVLNAAAQPTRSTPSGARVWRAVTLVGAVMVAYGLANVYLWWRSGVTIRDPHSLGWVVAEECLQEELAAIRFKWSLPPGLVLTILGFTLSRRAARAIRD